VSQQEREARKERAGEQQQPGGSSKEGEGRIKWDRVRASKGGRKDRLHHAGAWAQATSRPEGRGTWLAASTPNGAPAQQLACKGRKRRTPAAASHIIVAALAAALLLPLGLVDEGQRVVAPRLLQPAGGWGWDKTTVGKRANVDKSERPAGRRPETSSACGEQGVAQRAGVAVRQCCAGVAALWALRMTHNKRQQASNQEVLLTGTPPSPRA